MISGGDITTVYEFHCPSSQPPFQHAFQPTHGTDLFTNAIQVLPIAANACITAVCHTKHFKWTTAWQIHKLRHNLMIPLSSTKSHFTTLQFFCRTLDDKVSQQINFLKKKGFILYIFQARPVERSLLNTTVSIRNAISARWKIFVDRHSNSPHQKLTNWKRNCNKWVLWLILKPKFVAVQNINTVLAR